MFSLEEWYKIPTFTYSIHSSRTRVHSYLPPNVQTILNPWNTGPHLRKFIKTNGLYVSSLVSKKTHAAVIGFWGEWEPYFQNEIKRINEVMQMYQESNKFSEDQYIEGKITKYTYDTRKAGYIYNYNKLFSEAKRISMGDSIFQNFQNNSFPNIKYIVLFLINADKNSFILNSTGYEIWAQGEKKYEDQFFNKDIIAIYNNEDIDSLLEDIPIIFINNIIGK